MIKTRLIHLILLATFSWTIISHPAYFTKSVLLAIHNVFSLQTNPVLAHKGTFVSVQLAPERVVKTTGLILSKASHFFLSPKDPDFKKLGDRERKQILILQNLSHKKLAATLSETTPFIFTIDEQGSPYSTFYPKSYQDILKLETFKKLFTHKGKFNEEDFQWFVFLLHQAYWALQPAKEISSSRYFDSRYKQNFRWMAQWIKGDKGQLRGYYVSDKVDMKALLFAMTYGMDGFVGKEPKKMVKGKEGYIGKNPGLTQLGKDAAYRIDSSGKLGKALDNIMQSTRVSATQEYNSAQKNVKAQLKTVNSILEPKGIHLQVVVRPKREPLVNYHFLEKESNVPIINGEPFKIKVWRRVHGRNLVFIDQIKNAYGALTTASDENVRIYSDTSEERAQEFRKIKGKSNREKDPIETMIASEDDAEEGMSPAETHQKGSIIHEGAHVDLERKKLRKIVIKRNRSGEPLTVLKDYDAHETAALMIELIQNNLALGRLGTNWKENLVEKNEEGRYVFRAPIRVKGHKQYIQKALKVITTQMAQFYYINQSAKKLRTYNSDEEIVIKGKAHTREHVAQGLSNLDQGAQPYFFFVDTNGDGEADTWVDGFVELNDENIHQALVDLSGWLTQKRLARTLIQAYYSYFKDRPKFFPLTIINTNSHIYKAREILIDHLQIMLSNGERFPEGGSKEETASTLDEYVRYEIFGRAVPNDLYEIGEIEFTTAFNLTHRITNQGRPSSNEVFLNIMIKLLDPKELISQP